jgi:uncharacterized cofD-like protein
MSAVPSAAPAEVSDSAGELALAGGERPRAGLGLAGLRVVALGGGTGLPVLLRGLKVALFAPGRTCAVAERERLTAIVTAADDGGSSGRLRRAYRVLPPGDIRNCLLALSDADPTLAAIFDYRFDGEGGDGGAGGDGGTGDGGVGGHSLGNLILTALSRLEPDFHRAVERATRILAVRGRVLPATLDDVTLAAELADRSWIEGESRIATTRCPIRRVCLRPAGARALPASQLAIAAADLVLLSPGSLYTSLIPVLLVRGLAQAIARSRARVVLAMNLMTEPGETDGYTPADFVRAIRHHAPEVRIDDVLLNAAPIPRDWMRRYSGAGATPIPGDGESLLELGCRPVLRDLLGPGPLVRHDADKLARAALELAAAGVR